MRNAYLTYLRALTRRAALVALVAGVLSGAAGGYLAGHSAGESEGWQDGQGHMFRVFCPVDEFGAGFFDATPEAACDAVQDIYFSTL